MKQKCSKYIPVSTLFSDTVSATFTLLVTFDLKLSLLNVPGHVCELVCDLGPYGFRMKVQNARPSSIHNYGKHILALCCR